MTIFVKVRNDEGSQYDSYVDYWTLVNLSEFDTCELDEVDPQSDNVYIFSPNNGNVKACCDRPHKARYILWQLERPGKVENKVPDYFDEMWVSDRYFHSLVNDEKCRFVILGGHPGLGGKVQEAKWMYVHCSYLYGRRLEKTNSICDPRMLAPACWGTERDETLARSSAGLAIHQDEMPVIEPLRYVLFSCWKLPIVAEYSKDFYPYEVEKEENGYHLIRDSYKLMTETYTFRGCVEAAIDHRFLEDNYYLTK